MTLEAYCDADWAAHPNDRRSTTGYCIFWGENLIGWQSKKQNTISRSSTEAEFRSLASVVSEICWIKSLFSEQHLPLATSPLIWCDNLSTIMLAANQILHARTKHIEIDLYFVRDKVINKEIHVQHVPANHQLADSLTKPISNSQFHFLRDKVGVICSTTLSLRGPVKEQCTPELASQ